MFYEKCKTGLIEQRNNFNHSIKQCFHSFQFLKKNNHQETEISTLNVLKNGIYLLTMIILILFFLPFSVYILIDLFHEEESAFKINKNIVLPASNLQIDTGLHLNTKNSPSNFIIHEDSFNSSNFLNDALDENQF
jgi:hypothetical protein